MNGLWPALSTVQRRGRSHDAPMTVPVYNGLIFDGISRLVGPIYEHRYEKWHGRQRMPGRRIGAAHFPLGDGQSVLRRRVFAGLSADDQSAYWSNYDLRGSPALEPPLKRR